MRRSLLLESVLLAAGVIVFGTAGYTQTAAASQNAPAQVDKPPISLSPAMPVAIPPTDPAKMGEPSGTKQPTANVDVSSYVLGVEDQISVSMWGEPRFDGSYAIRPDGKIAYVSCNTSGKVAAIDLAQWKVQNLIVAGKFADGLAWAK